MIHHLLSRYETIYKIDLEENSVNMMGTYDPAEPLYRLIEKSEKGREFAQACGQMIAEKKMVSKGITLMAHMAIFNEVIREWQRQATKQKTWAKFKIFFHQANCEQLKAVTNAGKGGYTAAIKNIFGVPPPLSRRASQGN